MEFIKSLFENFGFVSYLTFIIVIFCYLVSLGTNLKEDINNQPYWTLLISNISFCFFLYSIPGENDIYGRTLGFLSCACICWFFIIRIDEKEENRDRDSLRNGKNDVTNGYQSFKSSLKNKASETVGGGLLGELFGTAIDIGTNKLDNKLSSFLNFFGDSSEYKNPARGSINLLRNILIFAMIISMFIVS